MLTYSMPWRLGANVYEIWFPPAGIQLPVPNAWMPRWLHMFQVEQRIQGVLGRWKPRQTLVTDLTTVDSLYGRLSSSMRYQIRRSQERDGLIIVDDWQSAQVVAFANENDPHNPNRPNLARLEALRGIGNLLIRTAFIDTKPVCVHTIVFDDHIARGINTYTARHAGDKAHAAMVGRATKASDFENLIYLRNLGLTEYDWGGYTGRPGNGIDAYKQGFHGELRRRWDFGGLMPPGRAYLKF